MRTTWMRSVEHPSGVEGNAHHWYTRSYMTASKKKSGAEAFCVVAEALLEHWTRWTVVFLG